jgi:hypothetical protein
MKNKSSAYCATHNVQVVQRLFETEEAIMERLERECAKIASR